MAHLGKGNSIVLTKIDIAEAQLRAALRMFFEGGHPVPVYTLANAAREVVTSIANKIGVKTAAQDISKHRGHNDQRLCGSAGVVSKLLQARRPRRVTQYSMLYEDNVRYTAHDGLLSFSSKTSQTVCRWRRLLYSECGQMPSCQKLRNCRLVYRSTLETVSNFSPASAGLLISLSRRGLGLSA